MRTDADIARPMVQDAKVALGERGRAWWEERSEQDDRERLAATIRALLRHRGEKTICPSDAARTAGGESWRRLMPLAREVAAALARDGVIEVRQRGEVVDITQVRGPVRLAAGPELTRG
ncbi:DUF3253 domain-containing protein [Luteipulveratus flavus]|uniref:DUF3253 domain-containing protein n=1 Tax=Luteipulveratus flavus TaxID=3031728 RepID=A0ABT6CBM7_9MICO|nr:DUF3253 domain-containing protein [Luteipulveratus sp. YIM 133296]MDF8265722.1 DUF3253 domain-containing protein [Luteipulveratus sp. YIM 133296]